MGFFSRKKKEPVGPIEVITDDVPMSWRQIPEGAGYLVELVANEIELAKAKNEKPYFLFSASFAEGAQMMREYRVKMADAYVGIYIIEIGMEAFNYETLAKINFYQKVPTLAEIGDDNLPTDRMLSGDVWGDDTLDNMRGPITEFLQGGS